MTSSNMTREQKLAVIYRHTHADYKGTIKGEQTILINRGATCLVPVGQLTDAEIDNRLPYALKKEAAQ